MRYLATILMALTMLLMPLTYLYSVETASGEMAFEDDIRINTDQGDAPQGSPDIAVDGNNVYIVWQDDRRGNWDIYFRASSNRGVTFKTEVRVDDTSITETLTDDGTDQYNPVISVDGDGVIFVAWADSRDGRSMVYMAHSDDNGETFSTNMRVSDHSTGRQTKPHMDISEEDKIMLVWEDTRLNIGHEQVFGAYSTDGGSSFSSAVRISDTETDYYCYTPRVAFSDNDNIHVVWTEDRIVDMDVLISSSDDGGDSFSGSYILNRDPSSSDQDMPDIDANETAVVVVWKDSRYSSADVFITISDDNAESFPVEVSAHPNASSGHQYEPVVEIEETGNISIGWTSSPGSVDTQRSDIQMTRRLVNGTFEEVETVNDPAIGVTQDSPALSCGNGLVFLAWRDFRRNSQSDIYYTRSISSGQEGKAPELYDAYFNPEMSNVGGKFEFKITYKDMENDPPLPGYPKLDLYYLGAGDIPLKYPGSPFNMSRLVTSPPQDMVYENGETYIFSIRPQRELVLLHKFIAKAASGNTSLVETDLIEGPYLDWTGPVFELWSPSQQEWVNDNLVTFNIRVTDDISGVDPYSISYQRYNLASDSWDTWQRKGVSQILDNRTVDYEVQIVLFEGDENRVRFRAKDMLGNGEDPSGYSISSIYGIKVDSSGPFFEVLEPAKGSILYDIDVGVRARIWDLGSGLDMDSINISYSLGGPDNYGEWIPIDDVGGTLEEDEVDEDVYVLRMNLSFTFGYNNFFKVQAKDLLGNIRESDNVQVVIREPVVVITDRPPLPVESIQPRVSGSVRPHITWTPTYDPDGDLVSYWFKITDTEDNDTLIDWTYLGSGVTYWDPSEETSLTPSHTYLIQVVPQANGLNGTVKNSTLLISMDANKPPATVKDILPRATSESSPVIRWEPSADPEGDQVIYFIRIGSFYNGGDVVDWVSTFTETKYEVKKILGVGTYHVQIMCSDGKDFSPVSHFTLSIGVYSPVIESERTSIVIPIRENMDPENDNDTKEEVELTIFNKGFIFDNIKIRVDGEATMRDDIDIWLLDDMLEISPGSKRNTTLIIRFSPRVELGLYSLNITVTSLDRISSDTKALTIRFIEYGQIDPDGITDRNDDEVDDTQTLLWVFFGILLIILFAMGYAYYRIDRRQREEEVDVIRQRKARMAAIKSGSKKELKGRKKEKPNLPPTSVEEEEEN